MCIKYFDLIFIIEHKDRELESVKLLAKELKQLYGTKSLILSGIFYSLLLILFRPKVFIFPYSRSYFDFPFQIAYLIHYKTSIFFNLNWEQILSESNKAYKAPQDHIVRKSVYHLASNDDFTSYLLDYNVPANRIITADLPKIKLLALNFKNINDQIKINTEYNKLIFMPMNYSWAFATKAVIEGKISKGYNSKNAWEYHEYSKDCLLHFWSFLKDIAKTLPEDLFILRPHPSITKEEYFKFLNIKKLPSNIIITSEYTAIEWLKKSDIVGSSWSTLVYDANKLNIPSFLYTPIERPTFLDVNWKHEIKNISTTKEFLEIYENLNFKTKEKTQLIEYLINQPLSLAGELNKLTLKNIDKNIKPPKFKLNELAHLTKKIVKRSFSWLAPFSIKFRKLKRDHFLPKII